MMSHYINAKNTIYIAIGAVFYTIQKMAKYKLIVM